jgi:hypothetical protein
LGELNNAVTTYSFGIRADFIFVELADLGMEVGMQL